MRENNQDLEKFRNAELDRMLNMFARELGASSMRLYRVPVGDEIAIVSIDSDSGCDHACVSFPKRAPKQSELEYLCKMLFDPSETVIEPSNPESFVSISPHCRHMVCARKKDETR